MHWRHGHGKGFYGVGTVGEKGQIVIPAEAREKFEIKAGDKFVFFGHHSIHMIKADEVNDFLDRITQKFDRIEKVKEKIKDIKSKIEES